MTNNSKQLSILLNPLLKIQAASEATSEALTHISEVVLSINKSGIDTVTELKKQTTLLIDIKEMLKEQIKGSSNNSSTKSNMKLPGLIGGISAGFAIVAMAGALVAASGLLNIMSPVSIPQLLTALAIAGIFIIIAPIFADIAESLRGGGLIARLVSKRAGLGNQDPMKVAGEVSLSMVAMAAGITASSYILSLIKTITLPQFATALLVGFSFIPVSFAFSQIAAALEKGKITADAKGLGRIAMISLSMASIALGIVAAAYAFSLLPSNLIAPDPMFVLKSAFAIGLFAIGFSFIMRAIKGASLKNIIFGSLAIPGIAVAITGVAYAFELLPNNPASPDPMFVLKSAFAIGLFAIGFFFIMKAIKGASLRDIIFGSIAIPLMAVAITGVAFIFQGLGGIEYISPEPEWVLRTGFALLVFSIPFYIISKSIKGLGIKELLFMTVAIPVIAFGILASAWIFQGLTGMQYFAPEYDWTLKAGAALILFGAVLFLSSKVLSNISVASLGTALIGIVVTAFAIIATAWILSYAPSKFITPPIEWTLGTAVALGAMAVAIVLLAPAVTLLTPIGFLAGALGIIVSAITLVAVGYILAQLAPVMPALNSVAKGFTSILLAPVNGIVDVFARFKNEIGIENMIGLAVGVAALGGAWLVFTAALSGSSIISGVGSAIGGIASGIGEFFGKDKINPIDLLAKLAVIAPDVQKLSIPLMNVGKGFELINNSADHVISVLSSLDKLHNNINVSDFKSQANSFRSIAGSYTGIANASKIMNIKAIDATTNMFKALDDLAKNGGESAMAVLAEKLMVAVKELAGTVSNLEKSVDKQGTTVADTTDVFGKTLSTIKDNLSIANKKPSSNSQSNSTANKEPLMDMRSVVQAIMDLEARFDSPLKIIDITEQ